MSEKLKLQNEMINEFCNACFMYQELQKAVLQTQLEKNIGILISVFTDDKFKEDINHMFTLAKILDGHDKDSNKVEQVIRTVFRRAQEELQSYLFTMQRFLITYKLNGIDISHRKDITLTPVEYIATIKAKDDEPASEIFTNYQIKIVLIPSDRSKDDYSGDYEESLTINLNVPLYISNSNVDSIVSAVIARPTDGGEVNIDTLYVADDATDEDKQKIKDNVDTIKKQFDSAKKKKDLDDIPGGTA